MFYIILCSHRVWNPSPESESESESGSGNKPLQSIDVKKIMTKMRWLSNKMANITTFTEHLWSVMLLKWSVRAMEWAKGGGSTAFKTVTVESTKRQRFLLYILYPSVSIWIWVWTLKWQFGHTQVIRITIQPFTFKNHFRTAEWQFGYTQVVQPFTLKLKSKWNLRHSKTLCDDRSQCTLSQMY